MRSHTPNGPGIKPRRLVFQACTSVLLLGDAACLYYKDNELLNYVHQSMFHRHKPVLKFSHFSFTRLLM